MFLVISNFQLLTICKQLKIFLIDFKMERAMGIEPTSEAWEASILPLDYARALQFCLFCERQYRKYCPNKINKILKKVRQPEGLAFNQRIALLQLVAIVSLLLPRRAARFI